MPLPCQTFLYSSIPATMQETVSPSFTLTSFIYVNASKEELAETAKSGDELYWNIRGAGIPQIALKLSSTTTADNEFLDISNWVIIRISDEILGKQSLILPTLISLGPL